MRAALPLALLLCLATLVPAAGATAPGSLSGTVTDADGDPVAGAVVVAAPAEGRPIANLTAGRSVPATLLKTAAASPDGVTAAETDADGRYMLPLESGRYRLVAVAGERVSRLRTLSVDGNTSRDISVARPRLLSVSVSDATASSGETARLRYRVHNGDDAAVENLTLRFPGGVSAPVQRVTTEAGTVLRVSDEPVVQFRRLGPGETAVVTLWVRPRYAAGRDSADRPVVASSDTHLVEDTATASVWKPPSERSPTPTALPAGEGTPTGPVTRTATERTTAATTGEAGPGFGPVLAVAAAATASLLTARRR